MMDDQETDVFEKQQIFNYIIDQIRFDKKGLSVIGRAYIEDAIEYFDDVKEDFERMAEKSAPTQKHYPLREIFEAINGEEEEKSLELILQTIGKLGDTQEYLEQLAESPVDFYQTRGSNELLEMCYKFRYIYDKME